MACAVMAARTDAPTAASVNSSSSNGVMAASAARRNAFFVRFRASSVHLQLNDVMIAARTDADTCLRVVPGEHVATVGTVRQLEVVVLGEPAEFSRHQLPTPPDPNLVAGDELPGLAVDEHVVVRAEPALRARDVVEVLVARPPVGVAVDALEPRARHPIGLVDLERGHVETRVRVSRAYRPANQPVKVLLAACADSQSRGESGPRGWRCSRSQCLSGSAVGLFRGRALSIMSFHPRPWPGLIPAPARPAFETVVSLYHGRCRVPTFRYLL